MATTILQRELQINNSTAVEQDGASVAGLQNGGYVVAWLADETGSTRDIFVQRFAAGGGEIGAELAITGAGEHPTSVQIVGLSGGGYAVAWESDDVVYARVFDASGNAVTGELTVSQSPRVIEGISLAATSDGGFVVSWDGVVSGVNQDLYLRQYNGSFGAVSGEIAIANANDWQYPAVALLPTGNLVLAWSADNGVLQVRQHTTAGVGVGTTFSFDPPGIAFSSGPDIAVLENGGYVVTWYAVNPNTGTGDVYVQRFNSSGGAAGGVLEFNGGTGISDGTPAVAALTGGGYVVAWFELTGGSVGVHAQRFDADGVAQGSAFTVHTTPQGDAQHGFPVDVAGLEDGGFIVTWHTAYGELWDPEYAIVSQRFTANGIAVEATVQGGAGEDTLSFGGGMAQMFGLQGNDTYIVDAPTDLVFEAQFAGQDTVQSFLSYTLGANLENLTLLGSGNIDATGNAEMNVLIGNSGNNRLDGGGGFAVDWLEGGAGDDTYVVRNGSEQITEFAGQGTDTVESTLSSSLRPHIENLVLLGGADLAGNGNSVANTITGNAGNNRLNGWQGADVLRGGLGDDVYIMEGFDGLDQIEEAAGEGIDEIQFGHSSTSFVLPDNIEILRLTGIFVSGTGNALNNIIYDDGSADMIDGGGGVDVLFGGRENDIYIVDFDGEAREDSAQGGNDQVRSTASYTLGNHLESLTLLGAAAINGTGNTLNNAIIGNTGANTLSGGIGNDTLTGGAGVDLMRGGVGNDTYVVDRAGEVLELANEGVDRVFSSVTYALGANVENLNLAGTAAINGTGNVLANLIVGNAGVNILTGGEGNDTLNGGAGLDSLRGGLGNDTFVVDRAGEAVEALNQGVDLVSSSATYTLGLNLENLTLTGIASLNGTGNTLNNTINGNGGVNILNGLTGADRLDGKDNNDVINGGLGNDVLLGGNGVDAFRFDTALAANFDRIMDFSTVFDTIQLENAIFSRLTAVGVLNAGLFRKGAGVVTAGDANDYIICNTTTGDIYYDQDGSGTAFAAVRFANVSAAAATTLTAADFVVV